MKLSASLWKGHVAMLFANMVWGIMSPVSKTVLMSGLISPIALSAMRIAGGALLFWLCSLLLPRSVVKREKVAPRDMLKIFMASLLIITANQALYIIGIGFTSPIDSSVMSTITPIFTMIFAAIFISMPITWLKASGVALGLGGALMLVLSDPGGDTHASNQLLGDSLCLIAQVCAALYYVLFSGIITRYSAFTLMKWMFLFSAITYVPCAMPWIVEVQFSAISLDLWLSIAYIIVFATFLGYLLIPISQRVLKPTVVSMYNYFQPLTAALLTAILGIGEFGPMKIVATGLIFAGVWFVTQSRGGVKSE